MARHKRPAIRVVFTARVDMQPHAEGIGEFLPVPVAIPELVAVVRRLLPGRAAPLRMAPAPTIREPIPQYPVSGAQDGLREFSWSTRRLLQLAAMTIACSRRLHDRAAQLQLTAADRSELARQAACRDSIT